MYIWPDEIGELYSNSCFKLQVKIPFDVIS